MRKLIGAINMTLDGYCDHTAITPDEEIHRHYEHLLLNADAILYGRITYQLMQYWQGLIKNPSGVKDADEFAIAIDKVEKIVFSTTLKNTGWESARLSKLSMEQEVQVLKAQSGRDIFVGSRSLIMQLMQKDLLDEFQLCIHPVIAGGGLPLFEGMLERSTLRLLKTKTFTGGAVILYYKPEKK